MRDVVEFDVALPRARVAELFADPSLSPRWMEGLVRYEPISGSPSEPGYRYRLVSSKAPEFIATVLARDLPGEVRVALESKRVDVLVRGTFAPAPPNATHVRSEEQFTFKGIAKLLGFIARPGIHKAHRQQMMAFKRFAESAG